MLQKKIILAPTDILTLSWEKNWSSLNVKHNNQAIGSFADKTALETGQWLNLKDGRPILVRLVNKELEVWLDNKELFSGLNSGQSDEYATAYKTLLAYGIVFILMGVMTFSASINDESYGAAVNAGSVGGTMFTLIGGLYVAFFFWAKKTRLKLPLQLALGIHAVMTILIFLSGLAGILSAILVYYLYKGVVAKPLNTSEITEVKDDGLLDSEF
jgi:hypothetical protein